MLSNLKFAAICPTVLLGRVSDYCLTNLQAVYQQAVEQKDRVAQGRALWQLGSVLGDQGQFKNAEVPLRDALAILEAELGSDHLDIAKACNGTDSSLLLFESYMRLHITAFLVT